MSVSTHDNLHREKKWRTHKNHVRVCYYKSLFATTFFSNSGEGRDAFENQVDRVS